MNHGRTVTVIGPQGVRFVRPVHPMSWKGEKGCFIGPFSSEEVASYYAKHVVSSKSKQPCKVLAKRDDWFVQVGKVDTAEQPPSSQEVSAR